MYLGPFFFDTKELFLIVAAVVIVMANIFSINLWWFDGRSLLTVIIIILITKGLLPAIHNDAFFLLSMVAIFLTLFLSVFQVVLFYFVAFLLFRLMKVI